MADKKISQLTAATTPLAGTETLPIVQGGQTVKVSAQSIANLAPAELPSQSGNANKYLQTNGTTASWDAVNISTADITGTLPIANGGTGQTSAANAINALLPSQASQSGKYLTTDGTNTSWGTVSSGTGFKIYTANFLLGGGSVAFFEEYNTFTGGTITVSVGSSFINVTASGFSTPPFTANKTYAMISNARTSTPAMALLGNISYSTTNIGFTFYNTSGALFTTLNSSNTAQMVLVIQTFA